MRTVDKARLVKRVGKIDTATRTHVLALLAEIFALFHDLSGSPLSPDGTELLIPPTLPNPSRISSLTTHHVSLTSRYEKAQHGYYYP
jgi:hypothetical protein